MVTIHPIDTIISDPDMRDGQPVISGSRVRVVDLIASHLYRQLTADELATNFNLNLAQVYAALAYYYQHKAEIDAVLRSEAQQAEQYLQQLDEQESSSGVAEMRFYFDESVEIAVSQQLERGGYGCGIGS